MLLQTPFPRFRTFRILCRVFGTTSVYESTIEFLPMYVTPLCMILFRKLIYYICYVKKVKVKVKQSRYRPGVTQKVPGS